MAAASVRSVYRSNRYVRAQLSAQIDATIQKGPRRIARFRARVPMARVKLQSAARHQDRAASHHQPGAGSDSESIASKGPDVPPDSTEQPATAPAAGAKKTTSKNGTKNQKSRTAAPRPAPVYFPFFFGR